MSLERDRVHTEQILLPQLVSVRTQVRSLASLSGLMFRRCRELRCGSRMWLGSRVAVPVTGRCSFDSSPSPRTAVCHRCGLKKKKKEYTNSQAPIYTDIFFFLSLFLSLQGPHPRHMEVPRLGVYLELQLLASATAPPDPSCIFDLHCGSRQRRILNPRSEARDRPLVLMDPSPVCYH